MNSKEISREIAKQVGLLSMQLVTMEAQNRAIMQGQAIILNLLTNREKADKEGEALWMKSLYEIYERQLIQITADLSESGQHGPMGIFRKDQKN
jgi:hypothetical protein